MKLLSTIWLPLYVHTTKSKTKKGKAIFNLNNYRNWFPMKSNAAKRELKKYIAGLNIPNLGQGPFVLEYHYYHGNKRKIDVANPCSVIDKFVCDALTELNVWPEDNVKYLHEVRYIFKGIDTVGDGYCILEIYNK